MIDRELAEFTRKLMKVGSKPGDPDTPVSMWREMDRLRGKPEETAVVIFRTRGCSWYNFSSCTMCGYFNDVSTEVKEENIMKQIDKVSGSIGDTKILKIFTSGSFLDPLEVPLKVREYFFDTLSGRVEKFLIESRTEYLTQKNLSAGMDKSLNIRIAIGLESSDDYVIRNSINKGSSFVKFTDASRASRELGYEVRTYLLFKPLFLSEIKSIVDMKKSIRDAAPYSDDISVNPMNIQKNTLVEYLWKKALYRPPRLWSIADILVDSLKNGFNVVSYPTGGNRQRGAHNESGDAKLLNLIFEASLNQEYEKLQEYMELSDLSLYRRQLEIEDSQAFQTDYSTLVKRLSSLSASV